MSKRSFDIFAPRNGHTLVVGVVARISGCADQKEISLQDQIDHAKEDIKELYTGSNVEYRVVATKAKGERLDRPELEQIETALQSEELDILWAEDLGRLVRGEAAVRLMGIGVDHGVRSICPNDCLDTIDENWHEDALNACASHVAHNAHTSKRIKQKKMLRFKRNGGATAVPIAGYIVPEGAETYGEWRKDDRYTDWIKEGFRILRKTNSGEAVADYFKGIGMPVGPYCRNLKWDGKMALRFYRNRLLGGFPGRGFRRTKKHHETGRRPTEKNPDGPCYFEVPHLAHVNIVELDDAIAELNEANKDLGSPGSRRRGVGAYSRSVYPGGGASTCFYCGYDMVWGGNGITKHLMCAGSRQRTCWNSLGFDGALAATGIINRISQEIHGLDGFDEQFRSLTEAARQRPADGLEERKQRLIQDEITLKHKMKNVADAIADIGINESLRQKYAELQEEEKRLQREHRELDEYAKPQPGMLETVQELRRKLEEVLSDTAITSPAFADRIKKLVPEFHVYGVRLIDGGHPLPRAKVVLTLDGLLPEAQRGQGLRELLRREFTLDLFEPPQREMIRERAVAMTVEGMEQRATAEKLGVTQPAVGNAINLNRMMRDQGLDTPYIVLREPPEDYAKLRRHKHKDYVFRPREGYQPPLL